MQKWAGKTSVNPVRAHLRHLESSQHRGHVEESGGPHQFHISLHQPSKLCGSPSKCSEQRRGFFALFHNLRIQRIAAKILWRRIAPRLRSHLARLNLVGLGGLAEPKEEDTTGWNDNKENPAGSQTVQGAGHLLQEGLLHQFPLQHKQFWSGRWGVTSSSAEDSHCSIP